MSQLILEVRTFYNVVTQLGEVLHKEERITLGMRAVIEFLRWNGPQAVPVIARARHVSRQRIQTLVNHLLDKGLVMRESNPASRRSRLISLSDAGNATIRRIEEREEAFFKESEVKNSDAELTVLTAQLAEIRRQLVRGPAK